MIKKFYISDEDPKLWMLDNRPKVMDLIYGNIFDFYDSDQNEKTIAKIVTSYKVKETGRNLSIDFALKRESLSDTLTKCQLYYEEIEEYEGCAKLFDLKKRMEQDLVD